MHQEARLLLKKYVEGCGKSGERLRGTKSTMILFPSRGQIGCTYVSLNHQMMRRPLLSFHELLHRSLKFIRSERLGFKSRSRILDSGASDPRPAQYIPHPMAVASSGRVTARSLQAYDSGYLTTLSWQYQSRASLSILSTPCPPLYTLIRSKSLAREAG